jgi:hypothetical protein
MAKPTDNSEVFLDQLIASIKRHLPTIQGIYLTSSLSPAGVPIPGIVQWKGYTIPPEKPTPPAPKIDTTKVETEAEKLKRLQLLNQEEEYPEDLELARIEEEEYDGYGEPDRDTGDSEVIEDPNRGTPVPKGSAKKKGGKNSKPVDGTSCTTYYRELPVLRSAPPNLVSFSTTATYLNKTYGYDLGLAVYAVMTAEARKKGTNFSSAGGHNYAGVQTDAGKWGSFAKFTAQFCKRDAVRFRMFAAFENDTDFLDFMAGRLKLKKFSGSGGDAWVKRYLNSWVFLNLETRDPSLYRTYYPQKLAIWKTAKKSYDRYVK